jgi:hypothetical protein
MECNSRLGLTCFNAYIGYGSSCFSFLVATLGPPVFVPRSYAEALSAQQFVLGAIPEAQSSLVEGGALNWLSVVKVKLSTAEDLLSEWACRRIRQHA